MDFDRWIDDAWNRHADAPAAVLADLAASGATRAEDDAAVGRRLHLAQHIAGAGRLLAEACAAAEAAALPDTDPAVRALAVAGNSIAVDLGERPALDDTARRVMLQAAEAGLRFWRRAGTWLHEERAHYRLAHSHHKAGDAAPARHHARACLALVAAHGDEPLERFFGEEALGLAEDAAGDAAAHGRALAAARDAFGRLSPEDQSWCRPSLDGLAAALP